MALSAACCREKARKARRKVMKTQTKCKIQKKCNPASYETRGKRKADRISGKERRNARNNTNKD